MVQGPYDNVEHYLDVHFRLLKEDFVRPLRDGIQEYEQKLMEMELAPKKNKKSQIRVNNVRIYEKVGHWGSPPRFNSTLLTYVSYSETP